MKNEQVSMGRDDSYEVERQLWRKERKRQRFLQTLTVVSPLFLLVVWEIFARTNMIDARFFPPPTAILQTFYDMAMSGELFTHIGISLYRIFFGFLAGVVPGIVIGLLIGMYMPVRYALQPLIMALMPIPTIALIPLVIIIFGIGDLSKIVIIGLSVFFPVAINTAAGVSNIDRVYVEVAKNYGAKSKDYFFKIALPGSLPVMMEGIQMGQAIALLTIVAAEMIAAQSGIGYLIWTSFKIFDFKSMFVGLILISFFGYLFSILLRWIQRKLIPWQ
ncbi:ABC transporter permease [Tuberibacillus sp. Marseille-P3662]|uniref:ABC transporter permease n=1 Tax=Tuberibacillus sp. Marseille-P3662 TaxID=1965358 RepID=UPI0020CB0540|nr:ABC transporter permease [Tuberibacillus sp. Marseille-P3662]